MSGKKQKWYLGGIAGMGAVCFTHPLDLIKVHLQTQHKNSGIVAVVAKNFRNNGVLSFYNGLSASLTRQATYTTVRFGVYEILQNGHKERGETVSFQRRLLYASLGGVAGALAGNPADLINVRMQRDVRLPVHQRYNYRHVVDGLVTIARNEGVTRLFRGFEANCGRAALMTIGQVAFYDQVKEGLLSRDLISDNTIGHFTCSTIAGTGATIITQPVDVIKTRLMQGGEYRNFVHCVLQTGKEGPLAFYKGFLPAWVRLSPQTILTWVFLEKLRQLFPSN